MKNIPFNNHLSRGWWNDLIFSLPITAFLSTAITFTLEVLVHLIQFYEKQSRIALFNCSAREAHIWLSRRVCSSSLPQIQYNMHGDSQLSQAVDNVSMTDLKLKKQRNIAFHWSRHWPGGNGKNFTYHCISHRSINISSSERATLKAGIAERRNHGKWPRILKHGITENDPKS